MAGFFSRHTSAIAGTGLIFVITLFLGLTLYFNYEEDQITEAEIAAVSSQYNELRRATIEQAVGEQTGEAQQIRLFLISKFQAQALREKLYERVNRRYTTISYISEFIVILLILFLSIWAEQSARTNQQLTGGSGGSSSPTPVTSQIVLRLVPFFAALAIAIPALNSNLGFNSRQQLHDFRAIQLEFLAFELEHEMVTTEVAWGRYKSLYRQSPASVAEYPAID